VRGGEGDKNNQSRGGKEGSKKVPAQTGGHGPTDLGSTREGNNQTPQEKNTWNGAGGTGPLVINRNGEHQGNKERASRETRRGKKKTGKIDSKTGDGVKT